MQRIRRKRKPATLAVNDVKSVKKSGRVQIEKISIPLSSAALTVSHLLSNSEPIAEHTEYTEIGEQYSDQADFIAAQNDGSEEDENEAVQSQYEKRQQKAAKAWMEIREQLLFGAVTSVPIPIGAICKLCNDKEANILCKECGSQAYFCERCALSLHAQINIFHIPIIQKDNLHYPMKLPTCTIKLSSHNCETSYFRTIICIGLCGVQRDVCFQSCECISESQALLQAGFFPASPKSPQVAFAVSLLDLLEALLLECQVAVQDFVAALKYLHNSSANKYMITRPLYPILIDCFEEYRYMKSRLKELQFITPEFGKQLMKCPACPESHGTLFLSIDGLFGLCRKKKAGKSVRDPLHNDRLFKNQANVDDFVARYPKLSNEQTMNCNDFLAANLLRSRSRFAALDETGVMGIACRHEYPLFFYNLRHGERISYIVYALEMLKQCYPDQSKVVLLYDVACVLKRHLKSQKRTDLLEFFTLAVPVFHAYGHKTECQLAMSPRYKPDLGLTDGEVMERLWSFLRRFSKMTKEMRPSHRIDILTDALLYYAQLSTDNLKTLLPKRYKHAVCVANSSQRDLERIISSSPVAFDENDIQCWLQIELDSTGTQQLNHQDKWRFQYIKMLKIFKSISNQLAEYAGHNTSHTAALLSQLQNLERKLGDIERKEKIFQRWTPDCIEYQTTDEMLMLQMKKDAFIKLEHCARERWFMLMVKAKFADGQYMASRISRSIQRETQKLKRLMSSYNELVPEPDQLSWAQVTDLSSSIWINQNFASNSPLQVPKSIKLAAINAYSKLNRANEELEMLKKEMYNTINFYSKQYDSLQTEISRLENIATPSSTTFDRGCIFLLADKLCQCKKSIIEHWIIYKAFIDIPSELLNKADLDLSSQKVQQQVVQEPSCTELYAVQAPHNEEVEEPRNEVVQAPHNSVEPPNEVIQDPWDEVVWEPWNEVVYDHEPYHEVDKGPVHNPQQGSSGVNESYHGVTESLEHYSSLEKLLPLMQLKKSIQLTQPRYNKEEDEMDDDSGENSDNEDSSINYNSHLYSDDSTSDYEDEVDYEAAARHAQMVKNRLEREEYLQQYYHDTDIAAMLPEVAFVSSSERPNKHSSIGSGRKTMYLHRPQEELNALWKSFQKDVRKSRIAEALANTPVFEVTSKRT